MSKFKKQLIFVWGYSSGLCLVICIGFAVMGAFPLVPPAIFICFSGGILGTLMEILEESKRHRKNNERVL